MFHYPPAKFVLGPISLCFILSGCTPQNNRVDLDAEVARAKEKLRDVAEATERRCKEAGEKQFAANEEQAKKIFGQFEDLKTRLIAAAETLKSSPEKEELAKLRQELDELVRRESLDRIVRNFEGVAYLTPGDQGYSVIKCDMGMLTMMLSDVSPYANGTRVTLDIGNPLATDLTGVEATVDYGSVDEKGNPKNDEAKSKHLSISDTLVGGAFTPATLVLDGVASDKLGFVRLKDLTHKGVSLRRTKR